MLLCDGCDNGFHTWCLDPALDKVPPGLWFCPTCLLDSNGGRKRKSPGDEDSDYDGGAAGEEPSGEEETLLLEGAGDGEDGPADPTLDAGMLAHLRGESPEFPEGTPSEKIRKEMRRIRKRARSYKIVEGKLYRRANKPGQLDRRIPGAEERPTVLRECHDQCGHFGINKTYQILQTRFFWPGMMADVKLHVDACGACKGNRLELVKQDELAPLPIVPIGRRVHMDCMGPYKPTAAGNRYVLLAVESWSKWPEARASPDNKAATLARFLREDIICRHGVPEEIITDRGREFSGEFEAECQRWRIEHNRTSAYKPNSNGQAERLVGVLRDALIKTINEEPDGLARWDMALPETLLAYRAAPNASTRLSPAMAVYGRELTLLAQRPPLADAGAGRSGSAASSEPSDDLAKALAVNARAHHLQALAPKVVENTTKSKDKNVRDYKKRKLMNVTRGKKARAAEAIPSAAAPCE
jgi:hypothetical protein